VTAHKGEVALSDLKIGNPEGFNTATAIEFERVELKVDIKSFKTDEPIINLVSIAEPKITLEQGLRKSNLSVLLENASRFKGEEAPAEEAPEGANKKVRVDKVVVEGSTVAVSAPILKGAELSYRLPTIEMNDIGGGGKPVSVAESISIFFREILAKSIEAASGVQGMPSELVSDLDAGFKGALGNLTGETEQRLREAGGQIGEQLRQGIGGLLGRPTPTPEPQS
jgi:hypothetical protein